MTLWEVLVMVTRAWFVVLASLIVAAIAFVIFGFGLALSAGLGRVYLRRQDALRRPEPGEVWDDFGQAIEILDHSQLCVSYCRHPDNHGRPMSPRCRVETESWATWQARRRMRGRFLRLQRGALDALSPAERQAAVRWRWLPRRGV